MADLDRMRGEFTTGAGRRNGSAHRDCAGFHDLEHQRDVISYTKGRGRLTLSLSGYEPCHNAEEVITASGYDFDF